MFGTFSKVVAKMTVIVLLAPSLVQNFLFYTGVNSGFTNNYCLEHKSWLPLSMCRDKVFMFLRRCEDMNCNFNLYWFRYLKCKVKGRIS